MPSVASRVATVPDTLPAVSKLYTTEAALYDLAFDWDVDDEVDWLVERLGSDCSPVLEPACGSGRMLAAFARRGIQAVGLDVSSQMLAIAEERLRPFGGRAHVVRADVATFDLGAEFGGAMCPIGSLALLTDESDAVAHLARVAAHLRPGSRYFVQLELRLPDDPWRGVAASDWEAERDGVRVHARWDVQSIDLDACLETHRSRLEVFSGPEIGRVHQECHVVAAWTPGRWRTAVARTPFAYRAVWDGDQPGYPERAVGSTGRLLWHELVNRGLA